MRVLGPLVLTVALLPTAAHAQDTASAQTPAKAVTLADIVGSWKRVDKATTLVFKADSTTNWASPDAVATFHKIASLKGDKIKFVPQGREFAIALSGDTLTVSTKQAANGGALKGGEFKFARVSKPAATPDSSAAKPDSTPKP